MLIDSPNLPLHFDRDLFDELGFEPIKLTNDGIKILDQTLLPSKELYIVLTTVNEVCEALVSLRLRGAPLIGITAAYGAVLSAAAAKKILSRDRYKAHVLNDLEKLSKTRPTAVNLFWAIERCAKIIDGCQNPDNLLSELIDAAYQIHREDRKSCQLIGEHALHLIKSNSRVLTICNAGALATGGLGTALAPFYLAKLIDTKFTVFAPETRPLLQGSRLTTWELTKAGIDVTLITDNMVASTLKRQHVSLAIVGADRIAANGDTANKIGTLGMAIMCKHFDVPLYVAAPRSTFVMDLPTGEGIQIEYRSGEEIVNFADTPIAPPGVRTLSPAFDVTPNELIKGFITEQGIIKP
jgi:methylthioribose-1-phosphate isomerase